MINVSIIAIYKIEFTYLTSNKAMTTICSSTLKGWLVNVSEDVNKFFSPRNPEEVKD